MSTISRHCASSASVSASERASRRGVTGSRDALFASTGARRQGFDVNQQTYKRQVERALEFHSLIKSRKPGGIRVDTVGYALWALDIGQRDPDVVTEDMTWYLLNYQKDLGHWKTTVHRPPTEASDFSTNYVAIRALNRYGTPEQRKEIAARTNPRKTCTLVP